MKRNDQQPQVQPQPGPSRRQNQKQRKLPSLLRKLQSPWSTRHKDVEEEKNKSIQPGHPTPNITLHEQSDTCSPHAKSFNLLPAETNSTTPSIKQKRLETTGPVETNPTTPGKKHKRVRIPTCLLYTSPSPRDRG